MAKTGYELSRQWFNWSFENPEKINPNHSALYFFCIEHCNRLGWKDKFGLPTTMAKEAIGIKSYNTYIKTLNDLVEFGFIEIIEKSKNQYSSNIIALSFFDKAPNKALDNAIITHVIKQGESTQQSNDSIDKPITTNQEPLTDGEVENKKPIRQYDFNWWQENGLPKTFSKEFTEALDMWFNHCISKGKPIKSREQAEAIIRRLTMENQSEIDRIAILTKSVSLGTQNPVYDILIQEKHATEKRQKAANFGKTEQLPAYMRAK